MSAAIVALYPLSHPDIEPAAPPAYPDHHERAVEAGHECAPRFLATCRVCGAQVNWCDAAGPDWGLIRARLWSCPACRGGRGNG